MTWPFLRALLLIAACTTGAVAQQPDFRIRVDVQALAPADERWLELRTKNFLVVGNSDEERIRKVAADLELFRVQFALFFPRAQLTSSVPTTVVVFRNGETFRPYRRLIGGRIEDVDGYFQSGSDKNYLVLSDNQPNRAIYREYTRTLIPDSMGPAPAWFRLGLSEYFTTYRVTWSGDSRWIEVGGRDKEFNGLLRNDSLIPLASFLDPATDGAKSDTTAYAQSWALAHYLFQEQRGAMVKPALEFFQSLVEGASTNAGFIDAFDKSLKDFEGQSNDDGEDYGFRGYVREARVGRFNPQAVERSEGGWFVTLAGFSLNENQKQIRAFFHRAGSCTETVNGIPFKSSCTGSLTDIPVNYDSTWADIKQQSVRLLSEAETDFYRGDLMLHIDRTDEAEGLLQLAIRIDPKVADAHAALGLLRTRLGRQEAALQSLKQATALDPDHPLARYYTALAIENAMYRSTPLTAVQLQAMAAELEKAVALAPHFVEAAQLLAEVNAQRQEDLDESLDLVRNAARQSPGRESLVLTLARVLAANHSTQEAGRVLDRVAASRAAQSFLKEAAEEVRKSLAQLPEKPVATQEFFATTDEIVQESVEIRAGADDDIPEGVLVPLNPRRIPEGETIRGKLSMLDCSTGLTLVVDAGGQTVKLHSSTPDTIEFVTFSEAVGRSISCGPVPNLPVAITYRPDASRMSLGNPIRIEFTDERPPQ